MMIMICVVTWRFHGEISEKVSIHPKVLRHLSIESLDTRSCSTLGFDKRVTCSPIKLISTMSGGVLKEPNT